MSDQAKACPSCGSVKFKPKVARKTSRLLIAALVIGAVGASVSMQQAAEDRSARAKVPKSPETLAKEAAKRDQAALTAVAVMALRQTMKDPTAFVLTEAYAGLNGTGCIGYRGKNSFGAMFPGNAIALVNKTILVEERDGNRFVGAWNKSCLTVGADLKDMVDFVVARQ